jgi:uncharacterized membrane protein YbhN (UPF0104 family)
VLAGDRAGFSDALGAAPLLVLIGAAALQAVALASRSEVWHVSVRAAGGTVARRRLFRASAMGNLGSLVNTNLGAAGRIAMLRRTAPQETPRVGALVAATAAAGVLLTVTGTAGALAFAGWAVADGLVRRRRPALRTRPALPRPIAFAVPLEERP